MAVSKKQYSDLLRLLGIYEDKLNEYIVAEVKLNKFESAIGWPHKASKEQQDAWDELPFG